MIALRSHELEYATRKHVVAMGFVASAWPVDMTNSKHLRC